MRSMQPEPARRILDAAAAIVVNDGLERLTMSLLADRAHSTPDEVDSLFSGVEGVLITMLNREFTSMYMEIVDHIERDPLGGLLSRIYYYTLSVVYERPLAKTLYVIDPDALNRIMRTANSLGYVPGVGIRADLIENMQRAGMVRRDIDGESVSQMLTIFSAGLALTAPHENLDLVVRGITDLLARAVDTDTKHTEEGKRVFYDWATSLADSGSS